MSFYLYAKALHIIFVVSWFAGLFYIVRLFIYHTEALTEKLDPEKSILSNQLKIMTSRLWSIITIPASILTAIFGFWMVWELGTISGWLWVKLGLVAGLYLYQIWCWRIYKDLQNEKVRYSSDQLRMFNEGATLFLISITFLVVLKSALDMVYGLIGLFFVMISLMVGIKLYKKYRKN
ncbi:CopD family protein [Marinigracilibium pacificum]|uniref:Protoporphyrinogen IX oxidase n=1 Tax=Marinigracilibium pacificum TaxID=2729599 RepID=A0A848J1Y9_9BACT|nr:CopD family protein [Marinigracilibium pacificum]NMM49515.1 CopD family protein [Marinigracilibium pacificum]